MKGWASALLVAAGLASGGALAHEEGGPVPPYRWVSSPSAAEAGHGAPATAERIVPVGELASRTTTVETADEQAVVVIPGGTILARRGATAVRVRLEPRAPASFGDPPAGTEYDGNAYAFTATYEPGGARAAFARGCGKIAPGKPALCSALILRYARSAHDLYRRAGRGWVRVAGARRDEPTSHIFVNTNEWGTFVATHPAGDVRAPAGSGRGAWVGAAAAVAAAAALGLALFRRRRGRARWRRS